MVIRQSPESRPCGEFYINNAEKLVIRGCRVGGEARGAENEICDLRYLISKNGKEWILQPDAQNSFVRPPPSSPSILRPHWRTATDCNFHLVSREPSSIGTRSRNKKG